MQALQANMAALRLVGENTFQDNRVHVRDSIERKQLANFIEAETFLVAQEVFYYSKKLFLHCHGLHHITKAVDDYIYQVKDLRNDTITELQVTRLT